MPELSRPAREGLLRLARASIDQAVGRDGGLRQVLDRTEITPELLRPSGVFVSLKQPGGERGETLRGCIGSLVPRGPLYRSVIELAPKAAFEDPRFPPLTAAELPGTRIELSVLTESRPLTRVDDLIIGRDGVELRKDTAHAVFLPQVAREHGWDVERLLLQLSLKAGLAEEGWKAAELRVFQAECFGEPGR